MVVFLTILIAIISLLLIIVVLVQNPKGGGLSASFGGASSANQMIGAANSTDFLEKVTWSLAIALLVLCLTTSVFFTGDSVQPRTIEVDSDIISSEAAPVGPAVPTQSLPMPTN